MSISKHYGYMGKILRVNLSSGVVTDEPLETELVEKYIGGTGFGAEYLYREVLPGTDWDNPENRIIFAAGPFAGYWYARHEDISYGCRSRLGLRIGVFWHDRNIDRCKRLFM